MITEANLTTHKLRIWLGGSFDPVHVGHLEIIQRIADVLENYLTLHKLENLTVTISLLPTAHNPLKTTPTAVNHRLKMLALGLQDLKASSLKNLTLINFQIDTTELYQTKKVFTFNTFSQFRQMYPTDSLIFVVGLDSIFGFDQWYRGFDIPSLCHLWVMPRGQSNPSQTENLPIELQSFLTDDVADLISSLNGRIYLDNYHVMMVSSSQIRASIAHSDKSLTKQWLTPSAFDYILENKLYLF